jgi:cell division transport system permease protein
MKKRRVNYFYSIISVAMVLFLLALFGTTLSYLNQETTSMRDNLTMMVELKEGADSAALETLRLELPNADFVNEGKARFITKEEAADFMKEQLDDKEGKLINDEMPMHFYDHYSVSLKSDRLNKDSVEAIRSRLMENLAVSNVYMDEGVIGNVTNVLEKLAYFSLGLSLLLIIVAMTLIHNIIKLNLFSDRFIIKNMELVGASWSFISRPYIRKGIFNGIISALLAIGMVAGLWYFIQKNTPELNQLLKNPVFLGSIVGLVLLGIFISWMSTYYVVKKYLRLRLDDLY